MGEGEGGAHSAGRPGVDLQFGPIVIEHGLCEPPGLHLPQALQVVLVVIEEDEGPTLVRDQRVPVHRVEVDEGLHPKPGLGERGVPHVVLP